MAECKNPDGTIGKKITGAFPRRNDPNSLTGLQITDIDNPVFDMTTMLSAAQNYIALNNAVNRIIGMEVRWFRAIPQQRAQDVIFQEYTLTNVEETPLCLKVVLPDGNFPDSRYNYDIMGMEYEVPLEIHIDKTYWESIATFGTAPQKNDIVYFAVPNKLYDVASAYLFRGFMEQETTWKINLRKHQPQASRKEGDILSSTIDDYTVSNAEIFGEKLDSDIKKLQDDKQMSPFNSTERDKYKTLDSDLYIVNSKLDIYGVIVAESFYDLNSVDSSVAITYTGSDIITTTKDRSVTAWTMIDPGAIQEYDVTLEASSNLTSPANYIVTVSSRNIGFNVGDNMEIYRSDALNLYGKIIAEPSIGREINGYQVEIDQIVIDHLTSIKSNWVSASNYKMKIQPPVSILDGMHNVYNYGWEVDIYANQYIKINYGSQEHIAIITDKLNNKQWYGVIVNIGNTWSQYNVHVYGIHPSDVTTKLQSIFYETIDFTPEETEVDYYTINKSPSYLTNLRLYNSTIEEEKQMEELLRYFVRDGDQLIIGDNADLKFKAPYISQQR
jgi:hypothetical protein